MNFNLAEKLAIVKAIDNVILADTKIEKGEMAYLGQLMKLMDFDSALVEEARKFNINQANTIMKTMSEPKKHSLAIMLHEMAYADGNLANEESKILVSVFEHMGIKLENARKSEQVFDISDVYFRSSRQIYIENGDNTEEVRNEKKAVKIEPNIHGNKGYSFTTYKLTGFIPIWGNKVDIPPIPMDVKEPGKLKTFLKGYNETGSALNYDNFSLSIFHPDNEIEKIILVRKDEDVIIEFLK